MQPVAESIRIENLEKKYDQIQAVDGVSFSVNSGEIFGLIGPDGAGKTSIIRTLVTLLKADCGTITFQNKDVTQNQAWVRAHIGYMPQRFSLYPDLTVDENLNFFADLFAVPGDEQQVRKARMYEFSRLGPFKNRRAGQLSGGMKQKLALSCMLMHAPETIVLDEPTFGVDPVSRQEFWDILKTLASEGTSILVTTAYMDEARLCDRVGLIFDGRILAMDTPQQLIDAYPWPLYLAKAENAHQLYQALIGSAWEHCSDLFGDGLHISDREQAGREKIEQALNTLYSGKVEVQQMQPDMEDLFLSLMKR